MFQKRNILWFFLLFVSILVGQTRIKTMFYNTLNYNSNTESEAKTPFLKTILDDVQPDVFMVCEIKNEAASNYLFTNAILPFNDNFKKADFKTSQSPATDLLQMVYYNSNKLTLLFNAVIPTGVRDINHYTFQLNTDDAATNPIRLEVFVTHLKASRGYDNMQKREESVDLFVRELNRIDPNSYVLFAGDFNFYTSNEAGFLKIINTSNSIQMIDPINRLCPEFPNNGIDYFDENNYDATYFWNNSSFADVHSQSTRSAQLNGDGAGGGMDDRFDFIMISKNLTTSNNLYYVENSYKTIGNNGNCYNSFVSNTDCSGEFSQSLRNALFNFSDHLPIALELESSKNTLSVTYHPVSILTSNYVTDYLSLKVDKSVRTIKIYNTLGQVVYQTENKKSEKTDINVSNLVNGLYYLKADNYKPLKILKK